MSGKPITADRAPTQRSATPPVLKPGVNIVNKTLEQVHVIMGFPGLHHSAPERYALFLLNDIIGGSMSSRLFQEVREREGLVYAIHSGVQAYTDTGVVYVYAATDEKNFSKVLKSTLKVLREMKKTGVTEEELNQVKNKICAQIVLSAERPASRMFSVGNGWVQRRQYKTIREGVEAYRRVTLRDIAAVLKKYPLTENTTVAVGPLTELKAE